MPICASFVLYCRKDALFGLRRIRIISHVISSPKKALAHITAHCAKIGASATISGI